MNKITKVDFEFKLVSSRGLTPKVTSKNLSKESSELTGLVPAVSVTLKNVPGSFLFTAFFTPVA